MPNRSDYCLLVDAQPRGRITVEQWSVGQYEFACADCTVFLLLATHISQRVCCAPDEVTRLLLQCDTQRTSVRSCNGTRRACTSTAALSYLYQCGYAQEGHTSTPPHMPAPRRTGTWPCVQIRTGGQSRGPARHLYLCRTIEGCGMHHCGSARSPYLHCFRHMYGCCAVPHMCKRRWFRAGMSRIRIPAIWDCQRGF